jgi:predicted amidohydrolase
MPPNTALRVALIQLAVEDGQSARNVARAESLVAQAPQADLYLLPELWTTGYAHDTWRDVARHETPSAVGAMRALAAARHAWIGGSLITERDDGALVNRFWLVGPDEGTAVCYDKAHLFAPMAEPAHLAAGDRRVRTCVGHGAAAADTALSICFDLRFPEQYRRDAADGAQLFAVVSEWPDPRGEALRLFARARAAENQAFLALCNRVGPAADGSNFCGGSAVFAPDGSVLVDAGREEGVVVGEVDRAVVDRYRREFPVVGLRVEGVDY